MKFAHFPKAAHKNKQSRYQSMVGLFVLFAVMLLSSTAQAILPETMRAALSKSQFDEANLSVSVYDITTGETLLSHHADTPRNPASVTKLFTTGVAIDALGPTQTFKTEFRSYGKVDNGTLDGHLIIRGYGDPSLSYEDLKSVAQAMQAQGIRHIKGNVLVDNTVFDLSGENVAPLDEHRFNSYNAVPSATMVNDQTLSLVLDASGNSAEVTLAPAMPHVQIQNELKRITSACKNARYSYEPEITDTQVILRIWGTYSSRCGQTEFDRTGIPSGWLTGEYFMAAWREVGNTVDGNILAVFDGNYSLRAPVIYTHESRPLSTIITDINKLSNNPKARALFLGLSMVPDDLPATPAKSRLAIKDWFAERLSIRATQMYIENGSGLSRVTQVKAENLTAMLSYLSKQSYFTHYRDSLPIMGVDGTLGHRMRGTPLQEKAWMKTGSIRGVKALAGYMLTEKGHLLAVAILHEDERVSQVSANPAHEALLSWLQHTY